MLMIFLETDIGSAQGVSGFVMRMFVAGQ